MEKKKLILGVIGADCHAVGNTILNRAFLDAGFDVTNLGVLVPQEDFIKAAVEVGADAIIVSNHGGRVLDQCPATAEVLESIANAVGDSMKILVDGGIRSGADVFKALALGADGVVIARPFVTAVYGGEKEGVRSYIEKIGSELEDTMKMCGVSSLDEINRDCVFVG